MEKFNRKILIIGIDGASWDILDDILNNGYMPYLKNLKENGAYGILNSTLPPISTSAWSTIQTGVDAIKNHVYEYRYFNKNTKQIGIVNSYLLENTIWNILGNVGKKVGVVNIPMTYPPKKINGYMVTGILTPSIESNFTYPPELKEKILEKIPDYQLKYTEEKRYGNPIYNTEKFIQQRIKNIKDRTKVCLYLINNHKIDLLMVNFQANDILQHCLWGFIDKTHELFDPKLRDYIFDSFYKNLDLCIEILREQFIRKSSGELLTIVLSDHGFESHYKQFYLGDWLFHQNLIKMKKESIFSIFRRKIIDFLFKINVSYVQTKIIRMFKNIESKFGKTPKEKSSTAFLQKMIDWKNSSVFPRGIGLYGYIFVLKEGKKKRELIESLKSSLFQIEDPENNLKIVDKIYTKDEIYKGDKPHLIPDLIIKPIKGYSFRGEFKNKKNFFEKITKKESETIGKHNEFGIIIMNSVSVLKKKIEVAHLKDIVPTILHFFQLPLPDYLDGDILNCFKP